jgi:hypothetical protein
MSEYMIDEGFNECCEEVLGKIAAENVSEIAEVSVSDDDHCSDCIQKENCGEIKILSSKVMRYKENRIIKKELWSHCIKEKPTEIIVAYNYKGEYIGTPEWGRLLWIKYGVMPEAIEPGERHVCSIGFSKKDNKFYGWSHRCIFGFTIGNIVKKGDCAYIPRNREEYIEDLKRWYDDPTYSNVEVTEKENHILVKYDIVRIDGEILHREYEEPLDIEYGRGEWTAETMEDAKQMAIDFARSVS